MRPDYALELAAGPGLICGIDEAGRGPWAGPVVAAAVVLNPGNIPPGLNDSKKLSEARREALFPLIMAAAQVGVGSASAQEIDAMNIVQATFLAMKRALAALPVRPDLALVDGNLAPPLSCRVRTVIGGDAKSLSISAASIVAKVTRDRLMVALDQKFPAYGFARHKGYGTAQHQAALAQFHPCTEHRRSFAPVAALTINPVPRSPSESVDS